MRQRGCAFFDTASLFLHMSHYRKFEIPDSWEWVKIEDIGEVITGNTPPKDNQAYYGGDIPFYKPTDLDQGIKTSCASDSLSIEGYNISRKLPVSSILVTCIGATIGKTGLILTEGSCNQQINAVITGACILPKFLFYSCVSEYFQNEIKENASATTLPILNKNNFSVLFIPLPPKEEQERIVDEIERLLTKVERIELNCGQLEESLSLTKSKILELAMQGKLVPQDPSEEPAADMLRRVNPKARIITDNPHSRNIPTGWCITDLKSVGNWQSGATPSKLNPDYYGKGYPWLNTGDLNDGEIISIPKEVTELALKETSVKLNPTGSVLVAMYGATIGKLGILTFPATTNQACCACSVCHIFNKFLFYFLRRQRQHFITLGGGGAQPNISKEKIEHTIIFLPSLNEQKRIVAKIEELYSILDEIEASLQS